MSRKTVIFGVLAVIALGAIAAGWAYGRPAYRQFKEERAVQVAKAALEKQDLGEASVAARKALALNPLNLEATLVMARLCEIARVPQLLDWRKKVAELNPTVENRLSLASAAIQLEQPPSPTAARVLTELGQSATNTPGFHAVAAEFELRRNNPAQAIWHFEQASRLEPAHEGHRFNLAVLRLSLKDEALAGPARQTLLELKQKDLWREPALRFLIVDRLNHREPAQARSLSEELRKSPKTSFEDQLLHLTVLDQAGDKAAAEQALAQTSGQASTNGAMAYAVAAWILKNRTREVALQFLQGLSPEVQSSHPVTMAFVDCHLQAKNWTDLEDLLQDKDRKWGEQEFLRYALLSRVASEQNETMAAETRWRSAVREAGNRVPSMVALANFARSTGREKEAEDLLWAIYQKNPREKWVLQELDRTYTLAGNTRGLQRVYSILAKAEPANLVAQNNLAAVSLLLGVELENNHARAKETYERCPTNATIASTYAFSLYQQGRSGEGLKIVESIEPAVREKPPVGLYYALLLAGTGQTNKAARVLEQVRESPALPEEKLLIDNTLRQLGRAP